MHRFDWEGPADPTDYYDRKPETSSPEAVAARQARECTITIHHNGDYSGNVKVRIPTWVGSPATEHSTFGGIDLHIAELQIPFEALKEFVLDYYKRKLLNALEQAEGEELEEIITNTSADFQFEDGQKQGD